MNREKINRVYEAIKKVDRAYEIWATKHGLTLYEMQIYYIMFENRKSAITQKDLCTQLEAPKTSINSIIKKEVKAGRIVMEVNPNNKREKIITLTPDGKKFAEDLICPLFKYEEEAVASIEDEDLETAIAVEIQFAKNLLKNIGK